MSPVIGYNQVDVSCVNEVYYLDTCTIVTIFSGHYTHYFGRDVISFMGKLVKSRAFFVTSDFTMDEIFTTVRKSLIEEERINKKYPETLSSKAILDKNPMILQNAAQGTKTIIQKFNKLNSKFLPYTYSWNLFQTELGYTATTNTDSYDARHLISAKSNEINKFVTVDPDYNKVSDPQMDIILPDSLVSNGKNTTSTIVLIPNIISKAQ